ncbi:MAG: N-6 DNA methylase, partial [Anaerolineae bacterium]|nr:N-6 DNA methylase [Anaerolineae bacterium]
NLFYNSPMEACVVVCRSQKPPERCNKVLFIDAVNEVARERAMSFLRPEHQERIERAYAAFVDEPGFAKVATLDDIAGQDFSLSIPLYVRRAPELPTFPKVGNSSDLRELWTAWEQDGQIFWQEMDALVEMLEGMRSLSG